MMLEKPLSQGPGKLKAEEHRMQALREQGPSHECFWEGHGFQPLLENSIHDIVLKGRGFKPRRTCNKINRGFSR
jgi:hypothetical protein